MVKFRLYVNKDRETNWLNEMVRRGYAMEGFFAGFYLFGACSPGEFIYQIDITEGFFRIPSDYREFMGEAGVEIMGLWGPWVFLRKRAAEGPFELYTDVESTIEHYTRIRNLFKVATAVEMIAAGDYGIPVPDYIDGNVSGKVVRIIQGFTAVVDQMVWRKSSG